MLHELHAQGVSISAIARQTGLDRKTIRRHLAAGIQAPVYGPMGNFQPVLTTATLARNR